MDTNLESADINVDSGNNAGNFVALASGVVGPKAKPADAGLKKQLQQQSSHLHYYSTRYQQTRLNQPKEGGGSTGTESSEVTSSQSFDTQTQPGMAYQHKHALHRLRRLKKRSPHRDLVISFVPRLRTSIINRLDFFYRYSKQEQEVLSCFDFLDELVLNYCDGGLQESPRCSQKLYLSMIYELI